MLRKGAALLGLVIVAGCGSSVASNNPRPVAAERHLVYEKVLGEKGIWIADVDGNNARLLAPGGQNASISPDGKWVAYAPYCNGSSSECNKTYVVSTEPGAKARDLMAEVGWPVRWSPDSSRIVTTLTGDAADELVTVDVASGNEVTLARGHFWGWSLSPDATRIVYALEHGTDPENHVFPIIDLYVTDVGGRGDPKPITNTGAAAYPVWGPKSIAFAKLIPSKYPNANTEFARNEIWRVQPDGTGRATISGPLPEHFAEGHPHWHCIGLEPIDWSDDGGALLASMDCEGIGETVAVDPQTGALRLLGDGTFTVALSQDAQFALVQWGDERVGPENERVLIYPYAGGTPKVVASGAGDPSWNR